MLLHTELTTTIKEKLGQVPRPLAGLPVVLCACVLPFGGAKFDILLGASSQAGKASSAPRRPYLQLLGRWRALAPWQCSPVCSRRRGEGTPKILPLQQLTAVHTHSHKVPQTNIVLAKDTTPGSAAVQN